MKTPPPFEGDPVEFGIGLLCAGSWFEAHEVLEIPWKDAVGDQRLFLQGLIQGAVSLEHLRRRSPRSALGQWDKARAKLTRIAADHGGLDLAGWIVAMDRFYARIELESWADGRRDAPELGDPATWPVPSRR